MTLAAYDRWINKARRKNRVLLRQTQGASYGRPVLLHNGRKPTARRKVRP